MQELPFRGAEMEAHINAVSLGTNTQEEHILLLQEFFTVCQENHLRIKPEKCEFMREEMEYLGFDVGYDWWKPAASKMHPYTTCRYVTTLRRVSTMSGVLLAPAIFIDAIYTILRFISPADRPYKEDQPLAVDRQGGGLFPGVGEEHFLYQLPGGTPL